MPDGKLIQIAALVPDDLAEALRAKAEANERSTAAELRLAVRAWLDPAKAAA